MSAPLPAFRLWPMLRLLVSLLVLTSLTARPALAQSILRDAETESLLHDMSEPLIKAAGLSPQNVKVVLVYDNQVNAFVAGGQIVYIHTGLISAAGSANEVQGVIAHEIGHITGGHVIRMDEGVKQATGIMVLSMLLGAAAMAAGGGDAGAAIMAAGQQAALGKFLAFSRVQEASADEAGASFLSKAGVSGKGSITFFKRLQNLEFRYSVPQEDSFGRTHPLTGERIAILQGRYEADPAWTAKASPALESRFQRVKAKLKGYVSEPRQTLKEYPETDLSIPARYARAYAWHKFAYPEKALAETDGLLKAAPRDPYFLELKGQVLLESGRPIEALPLLREAVSLTNNQPLIAATFGHALIATEEKNNFAEARKVLKAAVALDNDNPFAWYQLGIVYAQDGDNARAALATAERYNLEGRPQLALANAKEAMAGIPQGTADWLRAQDIMMVSQTEMDKTGKKKKKRSDG